MQATRVVVLGVGNVLMSDEGVGPHAVAALARAYETPPGVEFVDGGTSAMELVEDMAGADLLVIMDAVRSGAAAGELVRIAGDEVPRFFTRKLSPHQIGIGDVLASLELMGESPRETVLLGVEPESMDIGMELSAPVAAAVPALVTQVLGELDRHGIALRAL
jgi:hydrogenase maturation protease